MNSHAIRCIEICVNTCLFNPCAILPLNVICILIDSTKKDEHKRRLKNIVLAHPLKVTSDLIKTNKKNVVT